MHPKASARDDGGTGPAPASVRLPAARTAVGPGNRHALVPWWIREGSRGGSRAAATGVPGGGARSSAGSAGFSVVVPGFSRALLSFPEFSEFS